MYCMFQIDSMSAIALGAASLPALKLADPVPEQLFLYLMLNFTVIPWNPGPLPSTPDSNPPSRSDTSTALLMYSRQSATPVAY